MVRFHDFHLPSLPVFLRIWSPWRCSTCAAAYVVALPPASLFRRGRSDPARIWTESAAGLDRVAVVCISPW
jgi:hypothetical protein